MEHKGNKRYVDNEKGPMLIAQVVRFGFECDLKFLFDKIVEFFGKPKLREYLALKYEISKTSVAQHVGLESLLFYVILNSNFNALGWIWNYFEEYFSNEEILKIVLENKCSLMLQAIGFSKSLGTFSYFWKKIQKICENDKENIKKFLLEKGRDENSNALLHSIRQRKEDFFVFLFNEVYCKSMKIKDFIYETDKHGKNILHSVTVDVSRPILELILNKLIDELTSEELRNFLKLNIKNGQNILNQNFKFKN